MSDDPLEGLPPDLRRALRDQSVIVPQDQAVFEAIAKSGEELLREQLAAREGTVRPTLLHGGLFDGMVADTSGTMPVLLMSGPREMEASDVTDLDTYAHATWSATREWYELTDG